MKTENTSQIVYVYDYVLLRALIKYRKITQRKLAHKLGVDLPYLNNRIHEKQSKALFKNGFTVDQAKELKRILNYNINNIVIEIRDVKSEFVIYRSVNNIYNDVKKNAD